MRKTCKTGPIYNFKTKDYTLNSSSSIEILEHDFQHHEYVLLVLLIEIEHTMTKYPVSSNLKLYVLSIRY